MRRAAISLLIFFAFLAVFAVSRHHTTSSTTTTTSVVATTTTTTSLTTCKGSDFTGVYNEGQGAAGTIYASVTLTKTSSGSCTVHGYPLLTLQDKTGAIITSSTVDDTKDFSAPANASPATVSVSEGSTLNFSLDYSDVPVGNETCASAVTLSVAFASGGSTTTITPSYPVQPCDGATIKVSPFY